MDGGRKLKEWMGRNGVKTLAVCVRIGIYPNQVSRILNGKSVPSLKTAFAIQVLTNGAVRAEDFLDGSDGEEGGKKAA
jgi:transcriptional regulator with XRE-family HTH domain